MGTAPHPAAPPTTPAVQNQYRAWQEGGHFYIQMDFCEGGSLAQWASKVRRAGRSGRACWYAGGPAHLQQVCTSQDSGSTSVRADWISPSPKPVQACAQGQCMTDDQLWSTACQAAQVGGPTRESTAGSQAPALVIAAPTRLCLQARPAYLPRRAALPSPPRAWPSCTPATCCTSTSSPTTSTSPPPLACRTAPSPARGRWRGGPPAASETLGWQWPESRTAAW